MWAIAANIEMASGEYRVAKQLPTFYLHPNVQGTLTRDSAVRVAADILSTANPALILNVNMWITAERVDQ
ncbi:hypothetical protein PP460_gp015 [Streptomyces phage Muntaha]|uniref:Uncharacterized protein n=1 Tax=Streptomyces phage Muntaha TaxID=2713269 RepID=A0A6G8R308_9CAUD|nr:hypothetical protein PP460_gp001 [Streptomyces phage Muntaha]YP_010652543.1 hypothetical protein PP460_gp015 [Streptomyces phage Muntaha]QIN94561.1 hypothetical protein SEA_MUNTAHA_1 [Streptomyces phage Muntaha]QIN94787.1 hypothetical protein SEA_MUNTAHA_264 [Streptomyces phage Muntaha]